MTLSSLPVDQLAGLHLDTQTAQPRWLAVLFGYASSTIRKGDKYRMTLDSSQAVQRYLISAFYKRRP